MPKINYTEYMKKMRLKSLPLYIRYASTSEQVVRRKKPRDPEEDMILFLLDYQRWQKALSSGEIEKTGARRYRWHV